ncbi:MAG: Si-specific NAD(P)(+) transhydrogenase [Myxococcales bacterium]|nr:Si-specific NAD(P)(+) transhydrogenase [Myxococcales bacterium]
MSDSSYDYDLICIGSGPAGQRAAVQAAKAGKRVAVIEKRRVVGGVCIETGTIPSKTFREAVRAMEQVCSFDDGLGFAPKRKPLLKELLGRVGSVIERETHVLRDQLQRNGVNIILGRASFQNPHALLVQSEEGSRVLSAEHVLVACGTEPARPHGVERDGQTIVLSDGLLELGDLPRTMAVVGAGVIGIEYASMFAALGVEVTVVDRRDRPLEFLDHEIVDELVHLMRKREVTFRLGESVDKMRIVDEPTRKGVIELESGKHIVADVVLFSIGRAGATAGLNLDAAGLATDDRGRISVNANFQTEVPHIYAAGDVIGFPSLAATSSEQGRLAALHMCGLAAFPMPDHFPIGIYAIPEISMVGATEQQLTKDKVPYEVGLARYREIARGQILDDTDGMLKLIFHAADRKLLGVHAIGTLATEIIHVGQAVLALGGGLDYFLQTVFNYPTLAECYKVAALDAHNKLERARALHATDSDD